MIEMSTRIEKILAQGPTAITEETDIEVLVELARRWVIQRTATRRRATPENRESRVETVATASVKQKMRELAQAVAAEIRVEWTDDLLAAKFRMPDGSVVTWGAASRVEHLAVARDLESRATGDLKAAATHQRAASEISAARVPNLRSLQQLRPKETDVDMETVRAIA